MNAIADRFRLRTRKLVRWLSRNIAGIIAVWLALVAMVAAYRIASIPSPPSGFGQYVELALPYMLVALSPVAGFYIGRNAFVGAIRRKRSAIQLASFGSWRVLSTRQAMRHPSFGPIGMMASLLIGLLVSVAMRTFEFAAAVPALTSDAPAWAVTLFWLLTFETAVMNFFYAVCFVMALRTVPLFPKMLLFVWLFDLVMQLVIVDTVSSGRLPAPVAQPLTDLVSGNINTVLISMAIWLPYMILSERVNVTYRHRVSAR